MIIFHWIGSAGVLYIIANMVVDIMTSRKLSVKPLTGKIVILLFLWLVLART